MPVWLFGRCFFKLKQQIKRSKPCGEARLNPRSNTVDNLGKKPPVDKLLFYPQLVDLYGTA